MRIVADLALVTRTVAGMALMLLALVVRPGCRVLFRPTAASLQQAGYNGFMAYVGERSPGSWLWVRRGFFYGGFVLLGTSGVCLSDALPGPAHRRPTRG